MREGWGSIEFSEALEIPLRNGINRPSRDRGEGYKMINMGELFANDRLYDIEMELVLLNDKEKANFKIEKNDLLFARQSIVAEGAGKCSIVLNVDEMTCFESHLIRARLNNKANSIFFYYLFQSDYGKALLSSIRQQGVQAGIRGSDLQKLKLKVPPLETQEKIAGILSSYDDLIENNLKRIKILEEMAQQTYEEWFVRMRFPGYESATIDTETGLPEGWERVKLGDLWKIQSSKRIYLSDYVDAGIPFFRGKEITQKSENQKTSEFFYIRQEKFEELKNKYGAPSVNDILITAVGTLGNIYRVRDTDEEFYFKDGNLIWFRASDIYSSYYLYYYLQSTSFQNHISNTAIGSSQKALTIKGMKESAIIKPVSDLINSFDEIIIPISHSIENLHNQNQRLREARDILLPRLMNGMIEV